MKGLLRVLIVEDSEDDAALIVRRLQLSGYTPMFKRVDTPGAMSAALDEETWDIVISDFMMPRFSGFSALALLQKRELDLPFIIVSGKIGEETAVEAMKAGAHDYIMKGNLARLGPAIKREVRDAGVRRERKQAEEMIRYQAYYDLLTGLPNRTMLQEHLQQAIRIGQREQKMVALLLIDLDHFKEINNTLGHHRGDLVLQQIGPRFQGVLRGSDMIARFGGDEFGVVIPVADKEGAILATRKIQKALEAPFMIEGLPAVIEGSIGIALYPDHGNNADSLIQRADVAMYTAKETGSGYFFYSPEKDYHSPRRLALMGDLRPAIDENQLLLHYQPKVDLRTGHINGMEALVRWQHPKYGFIPPDEFIAPAERTGLIKPLTLWVFNTAQRQCLAWRQEGLNVPISVNISARNLHDPQLPEQLEQLLRACGKETHPLELEITESAIMADPTRALEAVVRLKALGIRFLIDDFGTGYSSLVYLKELPVDAIKIDKSFIINMMSNERNAVIARSTIDLGHNLGLKVVAEGVESKEVYDCLAAMGCDAAQGYYMSRPLPVAELTCWLKESPWGMKVGPAE